MTTSRKITESDFQGKSARELANDLTGCIITAPCLHSDEKRAAPLKHLIRLRIERIEVYNEDSLEDESWYHNKTTTLLREKFNTGDLALVHMQWGNYFAGIKVGKQGKEQHGDSATLFLDTVSIEYYNTLLKRIVWDSLGKKPSHITKTLCWNGKSLMAGENIFRSNFMSIEKEKDPTITVEEIMNKQYPSLVQYTQIKNSK